ncbi:cytoplasmic dynein 2 heavy chain 1-like isoform X2 [Ostrea edulis]|uniref:cytoplasmic dynein 2 heavy chain 1-like isoform X2 n=1 Tax=Ostrea edulis TaxID=37623 RepID=UPI0024AF7314|nr:cytoplasmic dynein 2 heavy chain 1-like isoform X2 [Ostrea edulis]
MDTVTKGDLIEISALNSPPQLVKDTLEAAFLLLGYPAAEAKSWSFIKKNLVSNKDSLQNQLKNFQADKCDSASARKAKDLIGDVTLEKARNVSKAASSLVAWSLKALKDVEEAGKLQNTT